ncbi:type III polyketide synthase [Halalkalibacter urbisdiaboli]|uniref:type III polyketide synthase n=1 Tax=Halalkalibacter urbisdiaboli TaxID=1960589 RepID=UPI000B454ECD|nr:type III polyketide synthase [Halalkalibacter urbisdiaboli]
MSSILSVSTYSPPYRLEQATTTEFARELFSDDFKDIERLLTVFSNGEIKERYFSVPLEWFEQDHTLQERNDLYIDLATKYSSEAIQSCLNNSNFLKKQVDVKEIDAIILVSSTGMSTPSLDARIMNRLPFSPHTKRIPLWGLGCAGGASGINRAFEYCRAFPEANVLVVCVELCSLTFQRNDRSKSNLIGTSLFADGVACALVSGERSLQQQNVKRAVRPVLFSTQSVLMPQSEEVMGWDVKDSGLYVVFSRDIPSIIETWLKPSVVHFLEGEGLELSQIHAFIAHPGGKKVLDAYQDALGLSSRDVANSKKILQHYGNMSSPTVLFVLEQFMLEEKQVGDYGLLAALGPGFSLEQALIKWEAIH